MMRIVIMNLFGGKDLSRSLRYKQHFLRWLLPTMGLKIEFYGEPPREPGLIMSNHRSYFDPIPVLRHFWALPVGKASIRKWPIIGIGAELAGTVFVDRSTSEARQAARDRINEVLEQGLSILIYPEGTIYNGPEMGELKMGMFRDAAKYGYNIHPVAIEYHYAEDCWKGMSFAKHFYSRFGRKNVEMKVSFGPTMRSDDAEWLSARYKQWVEEEIERLRRNWFTEEALNPT